MKFGSIAWCVGFVCVMANLCTDLISDLQTRFVPASWALCTFIFQDHKKQPWVVTRQSQGSNTRPEFSSDGIDGHGKGQGIWSLPNTRTRVFSSQHLLRQPLGNPQTYRTPAGLQQDPAENRCWSSSIASSSGCSQELLCVSPSPQSGRFRSAWPDFPHSGDPLLWDSGPLAGI